MFGNKDMSKILQDHVNINESEYISSIHQYTAWNDLYKKDGLFEMDSRGLSFAFCTDGVNPFSKVFSIQCGPSH